MLQQDGKVQNEFGFMVHPSSIKTPTPKQSSKTKSQESEFLKLLQSTTPWTEHSPSQRRKVKKLCRAGIPESLRANVWCKLARVDSIRKEGIYHDLMSRPALPIYEVIERDVNRCYPDHVMFNVTDGQGQLNLRQVLRAYAHYNREVEYCQGMGFLVGCMLMHMGGEDAFWLLVATIQFYADGFYNAALSQIQIDARVFGVLLSKKERRISRKMEELDVPPLLYITQWFITFFTGPLPWASALRVWDLVYSEGAKVFFRVALGILRACRSQILKCPGSAELLDFILHIPHDALEADRLVRIVLGVRLGKGVVERVRREEGGRSANK